MNGCPMNAPLNVPLTDPLQTDPLQQALARIRAIMVPVNPEFGVEEAKYVMSHAGVSAVACSTDTLQIAKQAAADVQAGKVSDAQRQQIQRRGCVVIRGAGELGIPVLTLFAFSTENWTRPADEVSDLMGLLRHYLRNELEELSRNGARLRVIGDRDRLARDIVSDISDAEARTHANSRIDVNICINYGARDEILRAARNLARQAVSGEITPEQIDALT